MGPSYLGLLSSFAILTSALSLPPSLSLINSSSTGTSNYNNQTLPNLTSNPRIKCDKRYGEDLSVASCRLALQNIVRSSQVHRFTRARRPPVALSDRIVTPVRFLSDDGICAIVCYPYLRFLFRCISSWSYEAVMEITRAISPCQKTLWYR